MTTLVTLASPEDLTRVQRELQRRGLWTQPVFNPEGAPEGLSISQHSNHSVRDDLLAIEGVRSVLMPNSSHRLLDGLAHQPYLLPCIGRPDLPMGGGTPPILAAGPCAAESPEQVHASAALVQSAGGVMLRGGAFKPRTSPYAFSGHGKAALGWLRDAASDHGLALVSEVLGQEHVDAVANAVDILQIGSRNMQNFALLRTVGSARKAVMLKRGAAATLDEWRQSAEHLLVGGAPVVIFCERGIRGSDPETRNTLDLAGLALLKHVDGYLVFSDPSHGAGRRELISHLAKASLAAGADGLLLETHPHAETALSDGPQALDGDALRAIGRHMGLNVQNDVATEPTPHPGALA